LAPALKQTQKTLTKSQTIAEMFLTDELEATRSRRRANSTDNGKVPMCPVSILLCCSLIEKVHCCHVTKMSFQTVYKTATNETQFILRCIVSCVTFRTGYFLHCEHDLK